MGELKKRVWINSGDIVLVSLREFQTNKVDILLKYNDANVRKLVQYGELTRQFADKNEKVFNNDGNVEDLNIDFVDVDEIVSKNRILIFLYFTFYIFILIF